MPIRSRAEEGGAAPRAAAGLAVLLLATCLAAPAAASTSHTVQPGETLSGIAAANGLSTESLASWNGLAADAGVISGGSIVVPTIEEAGGGVAAAPASTGASGASHVVIAGESLGSIAAANGATVTDLAAANGMSETSLLLEGTSLSIPAPSSVATATPALGAIWSPWGDLYLDPAAAEQWNLMREQSLSEFGQDLYPAGPLSAYRTSEQQGEMYDLYLSGAGAPANAPGSSSHELGISVDLATEEMRYVVDQIGWQYGWGKLEAPEEWWHVTYGGG